MYDGKYEAVNVYRKFANVAEGLWKVVKVNQKVVKVLSLEKRKPQLLIF